jgi:subtilase family serine protease
MLKNGRVLLCLLVASVFTSVSFAIVPDRIAGDLVGGAKVALKGNVHGQARQENDLGRADNSRLMQGITLAFHPSTSQQKDLEQFLAQLGNPSSPNYRRYLSPKQFGQRFGMSSNDLNKVIAWLQLQGFTNIKVANGRNEISFDGTVSQVENAFSVRMHHYLVNGVVHLANADEPSVPSAMAGAVVSISGLHNFAPKPKAKVQSHLTSYVSGNHFLTPGDFTKIYNFGSLGDGSGQKIAVIGQSAINPTDLSNFRSAAGLPASTITTTVVPSGTTPTKCSGDESESDLDLEWSGALAPKATIIFMVASLDTASGDTCGGARANSVWNALDQAVQTNVAPFISTSYGFCESGLGQAFATQVQGWAQQGQAQGQTIVAATGDAGAADCDTGASATGGLQVDIPAAIPEVTGVGGTEFKGDGAGTVSGTGTNTTAAATQYWGASGAGTDNPILTAVGYIPEEAWNDTAASIAAGFGLAATGGGISTFFAKPTWQTGTGSPSDIMRDVPDIALSASPDHDGYLFCSEDDGNGGTVASCVSPFGFRQSAGGNFTVVGGTSVGAPTVSAMLALLNQSLGNIPPMGIAPVNPRLYQLASSFPAVFNDVTSGDNKVPCTSGTTDCPAGTTSIGYSAGPGYDQVTGLGSVNAALLAQDFAAAGFTLTTNLASFPVAQGSPANVTVSVTPLNGFTGQINYTCSDSVPESTCTGPTMAVPSTQTASFAITTTAPTARLDRPFDREPRVFYAMLMPGLLGIVFVASSRKRSLRGLRFLGLIMVLGCSTMWLGSCGGSSSSSTKDPGTPTGTYSITITGTSGSLTSLTTFQLVVQ